MLLLVTVALAEPLGICKPDEGPHLKTGCFKGEETCFLEACKADLDGLKEWESKYRAACGKGWGLACRHLATMHFEGWAVDQDEKEGMALLDKACKFHGVGCQEAKDRRYIARITLECDQGIGKGCAQLGAGYSKGLGGVPIDEPKALSFYKKACDAGYAGGCGSVATFHVEERGGAKIEDAMPWFEKMCTLSKKEPNCLNGQACAAGVKQACEDR